MPTRARRCLKAMKVALVSLALVELFAAVTPTITSAQCPPPSGGCAWTSAWSGIFQDKGCDAQARFCFRFCNGVCEVSIRQWRFWDKGCLSCITVDPDFWELSEENVMLMLENYSTCHQNIPACPSSINITVNTPSVCAEATTTTGLQVNILPCDLGTSKCQSSWSYC